MARLKEDVKRFIVMELACYQTPQEVADAVKEAFGVEVTRQQVYGYNPLGAAGGQVAQKWKDLHKSTRERFLNDTSDIAIAQQSYRLRQLNDMARQAKRMKNYKLAAELMEQAAKERGDAFTNKRQISGEGGGPVRSHMTVEFVGTDDDEA